MKYLPTILLSVCALAAPAQSDTPQPLPDGLQVSGVKIEKDARRQVTVSCRLHAGGLGLGSQQTVRLVPVILQDGGDSLCTLPAVVVSGKTRRVVQQRRAAHGSALHQATDTLAYSPHMEAYTYRAVVPFRRWMMNGTLVVRSYLSGCRDCPQGDRTYVLPTVKVLPPPVPHYTYRLLTAAEVQMKPARFTRLMTMAFSLNSSYVQPALDDNAARLREICDTISQIHADPYYEIRKIEVASYASPEGTADYNRWMTDRRAASFMRYLMQQLPAIHDGIFCSRSGGEDWNTLRRLVTASHTLADTARILRIADAATTRPDRAEQQLDAQLAPADRRILYSDIYPKLRRNDYRVVYAVRKFDFAESRTLIDSRPELLDLFETQRLAQSVEGDSIRFAGVWLRAARAHPDEPDFAHNAAVALLRSGQYDEAYTLLTDARRPDLLNLKGVAGALTAHYDEARQAFREAIEGGDPEAPDNSRQLEQYLEFIAE